MDKVAAAIKRIIDGDIDGGLHESIRKTIEFANTHNDAGEIDAGDADCIVQVACFGEVVYG